MKNRRILEEAKEVAPDPGSSRSDYLALAAELSDRLNKLEGGAASNRDFLRECLFILQQLVRRESKIYSLKTGIEGFLESLYASKQISKTLKNLHTNLNSAINDPLDESTYRIDFNPRQITRDLSTLLEWYVARKTTFEKLSEVGDTSKDLLFDVKVLHDKLFCGVGGFEVDCALNLVGHRYEQLWLKVFTKKNGQYVNVRKDWQLWIDDTNAFIVQDVEELDRATALLPLMPQHQREIVDNARLFLPYEAVDLQAGQHQLTIEVGLFNQRGELLCRAEVPEIIYVPQSESRSAGVPSPQALGVWPADWVNGDQISNLRVTTSLDSDYSEWLGIKFNVDLANHESEQLRLECRLVDAGGSLIQASQPVFSDAEGYFLCEMRLCPQFALTSYFDLEISLPSHALLIPEGRQVLFCELSLVQSNGRVLCGTIEALNLTGQGDPIQHEWLQPFQPIKDAAMGLAFKDLKIVKRASVNGEHGLDVEAVFVADSWELTTFKVDMVLEGAWPRHVQRKSVPSLRQTALLGGGNSDAEQRLNFGFDLGSMLNSITPIDGAYELYVHASVYTADRKPLFDAGVAVRYEATLNKFIPLEMVQPQQLESIEAITAEPPKLEIVKVDNKQNEVVASQTESVNEYQAIVQEPSIVIEKLELDQSEASINAQYEIVYSARFADGHVLRLDFYGAGGKVCRLDKAAESLSNDGVHEPYLSSQIVFQRFLVGDGSRQQIFKGKLNIANNCFRQSDFSAVTLVAYILDEEGHVATIREVARSQSTSKSTATGFFGRFLDWLLGPQK